LLFNIYVPNPFHRQKNEEKPLSVPKSSGPPLAGLPLKLIIARHFSRCTPATISELKQLFENLQLRLYRAIGKDILSFSLENSNSEYYN